MDDAALEKLKSDLIIKEEAKREEPKSKKHSKRTFKARPDKPQFPLGNATIMTPNDSIHRPLPQGRKDAVQKIRRGKE